MMRSPTTTEWAIITAFLLFVYGWAARIIWMLWQEYRKQTAHEQPKKPMKLPEIAR